MIIKLLEKTLSTHMVRLHTAYQGLEIEIVNLIRSNNYEIKSDILKVVGRIKWMMLDIMDSGCMGRCPDCRND